MDNATFAKKNNLEGRMRTAFWNKVHDAERNSMTIVADTLKMDAEMHDEGRKAFYEMRQPYAEQLASRVNEIDERIKALQDERNALYKTFQKTEDELWGKVYDMRKADPKWVDFLKEREQKWALCHAVRELEYAKIQAEYLEKIEAKKAMK